MSIFCSGESEILKRRKRAFFNVKSQPWPGGEYFYAFDKAIHPSSKENIMKAFEEIHEYVPCVKFIPATAMSKTYILHTSQAPG